MTVFTHAHELIKTIKEVTEEGMDMIRSEKTTEAMAAIRRRTDTRHGSELSSVPASERWLTRSKTPLSSATMRSRTGPERRRSDTPDGW